VWLRGPAVERALTRLLGNPEVRADVVEAVVRQDVRDRVVCCIEQLDTADAETRVAAVMALGRLDDRRATPAARAPARRRSRERDRGWRQRWRLASAIPPPTNRCCRCSRRRCDRAAGGDRRAELDFGHPDMGGAIRTLLGDPDPVLRESALRIAGYFGYRDCVDRRSRAARTARSACAGPRWNTCRISRTRAPCPR
jgi:hypothetical protein